MSEKVSAKTEQAKREIAQELGRKHTADWAKVLEDALVAERARNLELREALHKIHARSWPAGDLGKAAKHAAEMWNIANSYLYPKEKII